MATLDKAKTWRWCQTSANTLIEFLTPSFEEEEGIKHLKALGVDAQSLHFLNYLLAEPEPAAALYRSGVLVQIPRPERFAIHKLIVASRRHDRLKAQKDIKQAQFLISVLAEDRPDELKQAWEDAIQNGARWQEHLNRSLERAPEIGKILQDVVS